MSGATETWMNLKLLFDAALQHDPATRASFLDDSCPDEKLRALLNKLLDCHEQAGTFLASPAAGLAHDLFDAVSRISIDGADSISIPSSIDHYNLAEKIGEGGMGEVWRAEQEKPVRRRVALKLIRSGLNTREAMLRFDSERQALALMDHPVIAKVFDAGATPLGAPYFVMEYVDGVPITEYCDNHMLNSRERLDLFTQVCEGVQHAHQKAIIHRDLKPSNILVADVDGRTVPKIIDFGVAKALNQKLTADTMFTRAGVLVGTPQYMSPEQANSSGEDIDTRTDVYSLGIIFYELLAGAPPIDSRSVTLEEFLRSLREDDPPKLSTKINSLDPTTSTDVARKRQSEPQALAKQLRGELDSIAMKALEKAPARRYASASEFAADIKRYLNHETVLAVPPSLSYRTRKFARRNRAALAILVAVAATITALLAGLGIAQAAGLRRVTRERDRANRITDFMVSMFKVTDPSEARGSTITAREILDKASNDIGSGLAKDPELQAHLMDIMGEVYQKLGLYRSAEELLTRAVELRRRLLGLENRDTLSSMRVLAITLVDEGHYEQAENLLRECLQSSQRFLGLEDRDTLKATNNLAWALSMQGRYQEAERLDRYALKIQTKSFGPEDADTLQSMWDLGTILSQTGNYNEAEQLQRQTIAVQSRVFGAHDPKTLGTRTDLVITLAREGKLDEAEALERETISLQQKFVGREHANTLISMNNLAAILVQKRKIDEAGQLLPKIIDIQTRLEGPDSPDTLRSIHNFANVRSRQRRFREAEILDRQVFESRRRVMGDSNPATLAAMSDLGGMLIEEGHFAEADLLLKKTIDLEQRTIGQDNPETARTMYNLACSLTHEGKRGDALDMLERAISHGLPVQTALNIDKDDDLKSLRRDSRFIVLVADAKRRAALVQAPK